MRPDFLGPMLKHVVSACIDEVLEPGIGDTMDIGENASTAMSSSESPGWADSVCAIETVPAGTRHPLFKFTMHFTDDGCELWTILH